MVKFKKLLSVIASLAVVTPVSLSIVACGGSKEEPEVPTGTADITNLLLLAKEKIQEGVAQLVSKNNHIIRENRFSLNLAQSMRESLEKLGNDMDKPVTDPDIVNNFYDIIKQDFSDVVNKLLFEDPKLNVLFAGLTQANILKLDFSKIEMTKNKFEWDKTDPNRFGIANYPNTIINTTFWYKVTANLKYELTYKDNKGATQTTDDFVPYSLYYVNQTAEVSNVVQLVIARFKENIKSYLADIDLGSERMNFYNDFNKLITQKVQPEAIDVLSGKDASKAPTILDSQFTDETEGNLPATINETMGLTDTDRNTSFKSYDYLGKNKVDFQAQYKNMMTSVLTDYNTKLTTQIADWSKGTSIPSPKNPDNVLFFGSYRLTNWTFQELNLTPIEIPTTISIDNTREQELTAVSTSMAALLATDGALVNKVWQESGGQTLNMKMKKSDFTVYENDDHTIGDTFNYINGKIIKLNITQKFFKITDLFNFSIKGESKELEVPLKDRISGTNGYVSFYDQSVLLTSFSLNGFNFYINRSGYNNVTQLNIINDNDDTTWPL